jgi:hypothetical protein
MGALTDNVGLYRRSPYCPADRQHCSARTLIHRQSNEDIPMLNRIAALTVSAIVVSGCGSEAPSSGAVASASSGASGSSASAPPAPANEVTCDVHYSEVREGILGALRGTEKLQLISLITRHSDGVLSAPPQEMTPAQLSCSFESSAFRRSRAPNTGVGWSLAPQCEALIQRVDSVCLQPLAERGTPFSQACSLTLSGVASASGGQQQNISNSGLCESAMRDL